MKTSTRLDLTHEEIVEALTAYIEGKGYKPVSEPHIYNAGGHSSNVGAWVNVESSDPSPA